MELLPITSRSIISPSVINRFENRLELIRRYGVAVKCRKLRGGRPVEDQVYVFYHILVYEF